MNLSKIIFALLLSISASIGAGFTVNRVPYATGATNLADTAVTKATLEALTVPSDTAFAASWNGVTTIGPSKNAIYDWAHLFDTDDDGKVNVLDLTAGIVKTDSSGVVSTATSADFVSPTDPITNLTAKGTTTFSGSTFAALGGPNGMLLSGGQSLTNEFPSWFTNAFHVLATLFDSTGSAGTSGAPWKSGGASAPAGWGTDNGSYGITFGGIGAGTTAAASSTVRAGLLSVNWNQYNTTSKSPYIIMKAGTITSVAYTVMGAGGDAVNTVSVSLLLNGTTVFATDTFTWTSFPIRRTVLTVSQAVSVNDYVEVQVVTPAGWTAPTTSSLGAMAMVTTTNN